MRLVAASKAYLLAGVRCSACGRFLLMPEGGCIPVCACPAAVDGAPQTLEHHLWGCIEACGRDCACPCHDYRPREVKTDHAGG